MSKDNIITPLSRDAFAVMAMCDETKKHFGITVNPNNNVYSFVWAFKIKKEQATREGFDQKHIHGIIDILPNFNGCPYCGSKQFYICGRCGKIICHHGSEMFTCPNCDNSGYLVSSSYFDLDGKSF